VPGDLVGDVAKGAVQSGRDDDLDEGYQQSETRPAGKGRALRLGTAHERLLNGGRVSGRRCAVMVTSGPSR